MIHLAIHSAVFIIVLIAKHARADVVLHDSDPPGWNDRIQPRTGNQSAGLISAEEVTKELTDDWPPFNPWEKGPIVNGEEGNSTERNMTEPTENRTRRVAFGRSSDFDINQSVNLNGSRDDGNSTNSTGPDDADEMEPKKLAARAEQLNSYLQLGPFFHPEMSPEAIAELRALRVVIRPTDKEPELSESKSLVSVDKLRLIDSATDGGLKRLLFIFWFRDGSDKMRKVADNAVYQVMEGFLDCRLPTAPAKGDVQRAYTDFLAIAEEGIPKEALVEVGYEELKEEFDEVMGVEEGSGFMNDTIDGSGSLTTDPIPTIAVNSTEASQNGTGNESITTPSDLDNGTLTTPADKDFCRNQPLACRRLEMKISKYQKVLRAIKELQNDSEELAANESDASLGGKSPFLKAGCDFDQIDAYVPSKNVRMWLVSDTHQDGGWGSWAAWSDCSVSCGMAGTRVRKRKCDSPKPMGGGKACPEKEDGGSNGESFLGLEVEECDRQSCPAVDGNWGPWYSWSQCSVSCGVGRRVTVRFCNSPRPQFGGEDCKPPEQTTFILDGEHYAMSKDGTQLMGPCYGTGRVHICHREQYEFKYDPTSVGIRRRILDHVAWKACKGEYNLKEGTPAFFKCTARLEKNMNHQMGGLNESQSNILSLSSIVFMWIIKFLL